MIKLWSVESLNKSNKVVAHSYTDKPILSAAFSPDSKYLACGCYDKTIYLWSGESYNKYINTLQGHQKKISCVAFSPDGKYLASGSWDTTVKLWSIESYEEISTLQGHSE
jgi:WD40 repeat protein